MSGFTGILAVIAAVAGETAATRLALRAGGTEFKFSAHPKGALAKIVGAEAAAKIVAELGPEKHTIPMAHLRGAKARRITAARLVAGGATINEAAAAVDVHERTIRRVRERMKAAGELKAPDLFDRD